MGSNEMEDGELQDPYVPIMEIKFINAEIFQTLGTKLIEALEVTLNKHIAPTENNSCDFRMMPNPDGSTTVLVQLQDGVQLLSSLYSQQEEVNKEKSPDLTGFAELFMIDTSRSEALDTVQVPSYKRAIKDVLDDESIARKRQKDENKCERPRATNGCFNCGSTDHGLRDCPRPRNNKRIIRAKQALSMRNERYHSDKEPRFQAFQPGNLSESLRSALGLQKRELPKFFYNMRIWGYPPGWLEEARVAHSGLTLFNADANGDLNSTENDNQFDFTNDKIDVSKLIEFPGFNTNPGDRFKDDFKLHNVPPIQPTQMKNEFIRFLGDNAVNGYRHKKVKTSTNTSELVLIHTDNLETADMEIDDDSDDSNKSSSKSPSPERIESLSLTEEGCLETHSLSALEEQQQRLLRALQVDDDNLIETKNIDEKVSNDSDQVQNVTQTEQEQEIEGTSTEQTVNLTILDNSLEQPGTFSTPNKQSPIIHNNRSADIIKESHIGTPILKFSPFDKLPSGDNFKVGVSDVINFENLPDSTGKYENMKCVIKKVRKIITKLHSEDD